MASGTISTGPQAENSQTQGRCDEFIQKRLEDTRRQVRLVDVASNLMVLAAASLLFFLAVAVVDQWVFSHGLGFFARLGLFAVWVAAAGAFIWRFLAPPLVNRINPVFAAQAIEQVRPTLKNSLINFLLLRSHPEDVAPVVFRALEQRAATDLLKVPIDHAVDRGRVVRLSYVLAAAVAVFTLYLALSPKNPLISAGRVLWPWSNVPVPTRVHIEEVHPGDKVVYNDEREEISALVSGLHDGEEVVLLVTTADGQAADDRIVMTPTDDANHFHCELPPGNGGFQQDTTYRIIAGDATTQQYKLELQIAPTILVDAVDYHFPAYTEQRDRTVKGQGDIKALEGTRVTIHATANRDIQEARIDLGCAGLQMAPMTVNGTKATGQFTLALAADNRGKAQYDCYQVLFTDTSGNNVRRPIRYHIDVDPDLKPEVSIVEPRQEEIGVPEDGQQIIRVHAFDPDFGLRQVTLQAQRLGRNTGLPLLQGEAEGQDLGLPAILDRTKPEKALSKPFDGEFVFRPADLHLKAGDRVRYWATAEDNKEPNANHSETPHWTMVIVPHGQGDRQDQQNPRGQADGQQPQNADRSDQGGGHRDKSEQGKGDASNKDNPDAQQGDPTSGNQPNGNGQQGKAQGSRQDNAKDHAQPDKSSGQGKENASPDQADGQKNSDANSSDPSDQPATHPDPKTQRADAIKDILKDQQEEQKKEQANQPDQSEPDQKQDQKQSSQSQDNSQQSGKQQGNPQQGGNQQSNAKQDSNQQSGNQQGSPQQGGGQQPNNQQGNNQQQAGNQQGNPQQGGSQQSQGDRQSGQNSAQNNPGQSDQGSSGQGDQKTSPQQGKSGSKPGGAQSQDTKDSGNPSPGDQSSQQNAGSKGNKSNPSAGAKDGQNTGGEPKPDAKRSDGDKRQQDESAGGSPKSEKSQSGTGQGKEQSAAGSQPNSEKDKARGQGAGEEGNQLAQGGPKPEKNKPAGSSGPESPTPSGKAKPEQNKPQQEGGNSAGGGQDSQSKKQEKTGGGGQSDGGEKPKPGQGDQQGSTGGEKPGSEKKGGNKGGTANGEPRQQDPGKSGDPTKMDSHGAPKSDVDRERGEQKAGDAHEGMNQKSDNPQSPGESPHDSKSSSDASGDRKGGGGAGGGQHDKKAGKGAAGTQMPASDGGSVSDEHGNDATGKKPGQQVQSNDRTGSPHKESGKGDGQEHEPSDKKAADNESQKPKGDAAHNAAESQDKSSGGQAGAESSKQSGREGAGQPAGGSVANSQGNPPPAANSPERGPDAANLDFSKKQVDLALEHLKEQMAKEKPKLLDRLGWTKDEARQFLENMNKLKDSAQQSGSKGDAAKKAYNEFLKNLDLHPHGTQIRGGQTKTDDMRNIHDSGQMEPPSDWADLSRAYSRGTAAQK